MFQKKILNTLVWRHLSGKYSRSSINWMNRFAVLAVCVGVFAWISVLSIMDGLQDDIIQKTLKHKAHLIWEAKPQKFNTEWRQKLVALAQDSDAKVDFIFQTEALLEARDEQKSKTVREGVILRGYENQEDVIVGGQIAYKTGLEPGGVFQLRSAWDLKRAPLYLTLSDTLHSGLYDLDKSTVVMPKSKIEEWLGLYDYSSRIEIRLEDAFASQELKNKIASNLNFEMKTWQEVDASLWYSLKLERITMTVVLSFALILALIAVYFAVSMRVTEKTKELALLKALGIPDKKLFKMYITEGLAIGLVGTVIGMIGALGFCYVIHNYAVLPDLYYNSTIPVSISPIGLTLFFLGSVIMSTLASLLPAKKIFEVEASQALRS